MGGREIVSKSEGFQVLWPRYFDKGLSRAAGRRVRRSDAVNSPRAEDIAKAVKGLKLKYRLEPEAAHPIPLSIPNKEGRRRLPHRPSVFPSPSKMVGNGGG